MEVGDPQVVVQQARERVGSVLRDKWRLDRVLGVGGMATVYAATHRTGSRAAIKMLHASHAWDAEIKRRFLREGYVANTVAHPGAVRVIDDDVTEDGTVFIVMDLLEGETLDARRKRMGGSLPPEDALPLVDQLLDILVSAHAKEIVHRDIKPENIFVTHEGVVKLLDFGVARLRSHNPGSVTTLLGTMFGTPAFMAPEQALGRTEQIDAQSDLWGVGAVMFSLLAGRLVHVTQTLTEQLVAHASRPAPSLATLAPQVPQSIVAIVDRALAFEKSARWPDARAMHQAVRDAQIALGWPVPPSMPSSIRGSISLPAPSSTGRAGISSPLSAERAISGSSSGDHPRVGLPSIGMGAEYRSRRTPSERSHRGQRLVTYPSSRAKRIPVGGPAAANPPPPVIPAYAPVPFAKDHVPVSAVQPRPASTLSTRCVSRNVPFFPTWLSSPMIRVIRCPFLRMTAGLKSPPPTNVPESRLRCPGVSGMTSNVPLPVERFRLISMATRCFAGAALPAGTATSVAPAIAATPSVRTARFRCMIELLCFGRPCGSPWSLDRGAHAAAMAGNGAVIDSTSRVGDNAQRSLPTDGE